MKTIKASWKVIMRAKTVSKEFLMRHKKIILYTAAGVITLFVLVVFINPSSIFNYLDVNNLQK
jgi:hypothetical protein